MIVKLGYIQYIDQRYINLLIQALLYKNIKRRYERISSSMQINSKAKTKVRELFTITMNRGRGRDSKLPVLFCE